MKTTFKVGIMCGLAVLLATAGVRAEDSNTFTFGGDVELDITNVDKSDSDDTFGHGGRIKLNAVGQAKRGNAFVKGVAQPMLTFKDSDLAIDDVYLQFGQANWDLQLGRFEAMDLFPAGKDTVVEHAGGVSVYGANTLRGRKDDVLHGALHLKPMSNVNFELGAMGAKSGDDDFSGVRPALSYQAGAVTIRAGYETSTENEDDVETKKSGYGLSGGFKLGAGALNASVAKGSTEVDGVDSPDVTSAAVNYTQGPFGLGYIHSEQDATTGDDPKVDSFYGAYSTPLLGIKDATVTLAASTSKAKNVSTDDKVNAVRVRFNYAF